MKAYKLTDENHCTRGDTKWGENISHTATGKEQHLCTNGWIHFYTDPHLAVFMNPIHAGFKNPVMWECETSGKHLHEALKSGCKKLTTIKQIPMSEVTLTQKIAFAILCAMEVYKDPAWRKWAKNWLSGKDRTYVAAAEAAARAAVYSAASDAAYYAASAAAYYAAVAASEAAEAAKAVAIAATVTNTAEAASCATDTAKDIDFIEIARKALTYQLNTFVSTKSVR